MEPSQYALQYDALMGRWSSAMACEFVGWLAPECRQRWLDVGCGTGALVGAILADAEPAAVWGIDAEPEYIQQARHAIRDRRCRFLVSDAARLPQEIVNVDVTVSALVLNLVSNPAEVLAEMIRVTRPGGRIATYLWDFAGGMQLARNFWDAAIALDPAAASLDQGRRYPLCHPERLRDLFRGAGLEFGEVQALYVPTVFRNFEDYWAPIETGHGRASEYVATLARDHLERLRESLRARLPRAADGSIPLTARAWAIDSHT
jgi:SAM-dependent methyltransferase